MGLSRRLYSVVDSAFGSLGSLRCSIFQAFAAGSNGTRDRCYGLDFRRPDTIHAFNQRSFRTPVSCSLGRPRPKPAPSRPGNGFPSSSSLHGLCRNGGSFCFCGSCSYRRKIRCCLGPLDTSMDKHCLDLFNSRHCSWFLVGLL